jgi:hypothetical protein
MSLYKVYIQWGMRCSNIQLRRERERYRVLRFWKREVEKLEIENELNCE